MMLAVIILHLWTIVIPPAEAKDEVETFWLRQVFDHYSNGKETYWKQRYLVNKKSWKNETNSPVFLMISGSNGVSNKSMTEGSWVQWAEKYGALLVHLEHRFYGESRPTPDTSKSNLENLRGIQAISDLSKLIEHINEKYNLKSTNKWIMFGCDYPGSLAVWTRYQMPSKVYAVVASGARLHLKYDFHEYWDVAAKAMETVAPNCAKNFKKTLSIIKFYNDEFLPTLLNFSLCDNYNPQSKDDVIRFYIRLGEMLEPAVEYNGQSSGPNNIEYICKFINNETEPDYLNRLIALIRDRNKGCLDVSQEEFIKTYNNTSWNHPVNKEGSRQRLWQSCINVGQFKNSNGTNSLFQENIPLDYFVDLCETLFGFERDVDQFVVGFANLLNDFSAKRILLVEGTLDPWSPLDKVFHPIDDTPVVKIKGGSHCQVMLNPKDSDSTELIKARETIDSYLAKWAK